MRHNILAVAMSLTKYSQHDFQPETALTYKPKAKTVKKVFKLDPRPEYCNGFKIWLSDLGYKRKDFEDGGCTFKNKTLMPSYIVIGNDLTTNQYGYKLYKEYCGHLAAQD